MTGANGDKPGPPASVPPYAVQRCLPRYKLDLRLRLSVPATGQKIHARSSDISQGGMGLFAPVELQVNDPVYLEFTLPYTGKPQRCAAIVRNRNGYRYGVEFRHLPAATRHAIARACTALSLLTE